MRSLSNRTYILLDQLINLKTVFSAGHSCINHITLTTKLITIEMKYWLSKSIERNSIQMYTLGWHQVNSNKKKTGIRASKKNREKYPHSKLIKLFKVICFRFFASPAAAAAVADVFTLMPMDFSFPLVRFSLFFYGCCCSVVSSSISDGWRDQTNKIASNILVFEAVNSFMFIIIDHVIVKWKKIWKTKNIPINVVCV